MHRKINENTVSPSMTRTQYELRLTQILTDPGLEQESIMTTDQYIPKFLTKCRLDDACIVTPDK